MKRRMGAMGAVALAIVASLGAGYWWGSSHGDDSTTPTVAGQRRVLYWYDPMKPEQRFDKPGPSPFMDMPLQPKYADDVAAGGISIAPDTRQSLGLRTLVVRRGRLATALHVPGTIGWDLRQERVVSARVDSIVERLHVRAPFEPVRAGQPLATVLAPGWGTAAAEAQALGRSQSGSARALQAAARARVRALGVPAGSRVGLDGRITLTSPVSGVVSEIGVREGQSAPTGLLLFRVNGTRTVWLEAAIPQAAAAGVAAGTPVEATVDAYPDRRFAGRVEALLPQIDAATRTRRARIVLDNPAGVLAPGMFAQVALQPEEGAEHPLVPTDALIVTGDQARVIVLGADDRFHAVAVRLGRSGGGMTEVLGGLQGGERVVAAGQFLIDSEANLSGALERLNAGALPPAPRAGGELRPDDALPGMPGGDVPSSVEHAHGAHAAGAARVPPAEGETIHSHDHAAMPESSAAGDHGPEPQP